jgi:hypothetical protein
MFDYTASLACVNAATQQHSVAALFSELINYLLTACGCRRLTSAGHWEGVRSTLDMMLWGSSGDAQHQRTIMFEVFCLGTSCDTSSFRTGSAHITLSLVLPCPIRQAS